MFDEFMMVSTSPNVVERLRLKTEYAWRKGFTVRFELLDGRDAAWCEIRGNKMIFVDLALTAGEQLEQLERVLDEFERSNTSTLKRQAA
jgi:hypothetical protein